MGYESQRCRVRLGLSLLVISGAHCLSQGTGSCYVVVGGTSVKSAHAAAPSLAWNQPFDLYGFRSLHVRLSS